MTGTEYGGGSLRVFLVGFMGAGKTSTGKALARRVGAAFWDLDERIEAATGMTVPEIFSRHGEGFFRDEESRQLILASGRDRLVVATGGGTFARDANRRTIAALGVSVFLDTPWDEVLRRLPGKRSERPLFKTPEAALELYRKRLSAYKLADLRVTPGTGEDAEAVAGRLLILLEQSRCAT